MIPSTVRPRGPSVGLALLLGAVVVGLAGCGEGKANKAEDKRIQSLGEQVAQLSAKVKAQDERIAGLGTTDRTSPLAASTQSGPDNTVVAQCAPGSFLFRLPRTPGQGGEALCRPVAAPTGNEIKGH